MTSAADHPLMVELFRMVPPAGSVWPMDRRALWFETMEAVLNLIYPPPAVRIAIGLDAEETAEHVIRTKLSTALTADDIAAMGPGRLELDAPRAPIASSIDDVAAAAQPESPTEPNPEPDVPEPPAFKPSGKVATEPKGRTPAALAPRPAGIPTTYAMIQIVLSEKPGLNARELVAEMAARWWPELEFNRVAPDISTWVTKGRLKRDADGKLTLTEQDRNVKSLDFRTAAPESVGAIDVKVPEPPQDPPGKLLQRPVTPPERPPVSAAALRFAEQRNASSKPAPAPAPAPKPAATHPFEWGGGTIQLTLREHRVLSKLKAAMGKGMIEGRLLVDAAFAGEPNKPANSDMYLQEIILQVSPRLDQLGLGMVGVPTMSGSIKIAGYVLRGK